MFWSMPKDTAMLDFGDLVALHGFENVNAQMYSAGYKVWQVDLNLLECNYN